MPSTHFIFDPSLTGPPLAEVILTGTVAVSPMIDYNGETYLLRSSYQHEDGTAELLYLPLFTKPNYDSRN